MKHRWFLVVLAGCLAAAGCASSSVAVQPGQTATVIAFNPFTGPDASFGPEMMAGCQPAVRSVNAAGGVLGVKLSCLAVDTRGDPADAVPAASKMLATTSNVFGVLGPSSDEADATAPLISQAHVPMFGDTGEASFDHTSLKYFWRITPADDVKGYAMAIWAVAHGYMRAAAIFGNDVSSQSNVPTLVKAYRLLGAKVVVNESLALDQPSYRAEVARVISAHPQILFTEASPQTDATFLSELQQQGALIPVMGTDTTLQPQWLTAVSGAIGKPALSKYYTGEQPYAPAAGPSWATYNNWLLASSAQVPKPSQWSTDSYTMTDYDGVIVMALAAVAAKSTDPAKFNAYIPDVTTPAPGKTIVHSYAQGLQALRAGKKIQYIGAGGAIDFSQWHNNAGGFEIASYHTNGQVSLTGEVTATQIAPLLKRG
jgi:ABC-type branched-subunit amino acid transport system substrate-binding protein